MDGSYHSSCPSAANTCRRMILTTGLQAPQDQRFCESKILSLQSCPMRHKQTPVTWKLRRRRRRSAPVRYAVQGFARRQTWRSKAANRRATGSEEEAADGNSKSLRAAVAASRSLQMTSTCSIASTPNNDLFPNSLKVCRCRSAQERCAARVDEATLQCAACP